MWDRFDDAMDDIRDDIVDTRNRMAEVEAKIKELGGEVPAWDGPVKGNTPGPSGTYQDGLSEENQYDARLAKLKRILAELENKD